MANARLIAKSISTSKRWNQLPSWLSKTLYMLLIIHSDDYGILDGDAEEIKWKVLPAATEKIPEIEKALQEIHKSGLINRYEWQGHFLIEINQFDPHQQGLHKRTARKYPSLKDLQESGDVFREIPGNSENFPLIRLDKNRLEYISSDCSDDERETLAKNGHKKRPSKDNGGEYIQEKAEVIAYLNELRGITPGFKPNSKATNHISARLSEGYSVEDCKTVITLKIKEWKNTKWSQFLRPDTLFNSEKFEGYLVEAHGSKAETVDPQTAFAQEISRKRKESSNGQ